MISFCDTVPIYLRGDYRGFLVVELQDQQPTYRLIMEGDEELQEPLTLDRIKGSLFFAGLHRNAIQRVTVLKDAYRCSGECNLTDAIQRAQESIISYQNDEPITDALNDRYSWSTEYIAEAGITLIGKVKLHLHGTTDLREFFTKAPQFKSTTNPPGTFLAYEVVDLEVFVRPHTNPVHLLEYHLGTAVTTTYKGQHYQFTTRDLQRFMKSKTLKPETLGTPEFEIDEKGDGRFDNK